MNVLALTGPLPYRFFLSPTIALEICLRSSPRAVTERSVSLIHGKLLLADTLCCASGDLPAARQLAWVPQERGSGQPQPPESFAARLPQARSFQMSHKSFAQLGVSRAVVRA